MMKAAIRKPSFFVVASLIVFTITGLYMFYGYAETIKGFSRSVIAIFGTCAVDYTYEVEIPSELMRADLIMPLAQTDPTPIVLTLDSIRGSEFDLVCFYDTPNTSEVPSGQFQLWPPAIETPLYLESGDKLVFQCENDALTSFGIRMVLNGPNSETIEQICE